MIMISSAITLMLYCVFIMGLVLAIIGFIILGSWCLYVNCYKWVCNFHKGNYKKIYISHPYQNKFDNKNRIETIIKDIVKKDKKNIYISPVHTFGFLYDKVDYETGINYCLELLKTCDEMWVFGDYMNSKGCNLEIEYCKKHNIPYKIFK